MLELVHWNACMAPRGHICISYSVPLWSLSVTTSSGGSLPNSVVESPVPLLMIIMTVTWKVHTACIYSRPPLYFPCVHVCYCTHAKFCYARWPGLHMCMHITFFLMYSAFVVKPGLSDVQRSQLWAQSLWSQGLSFQIRYMNVHEFYFELTLQLVRSVSTFGGKHLH